MIIQKPIDEETAELLWEYTLKHCKGFSRDFLEQRKPDFMIGLMVASGTLADYIDLHKCSFSQQEIDDLLLTASESAGVWLDKYAEQHPCSQVRQ